MGEKKKQRLAEAEAAKTLATIADTPPHGDEATEAAAVPPTAESVPTHPEELRASVTLRIGDKISLSATARATPAGLVASALIVTAAMVPLIWITRRR
ncbi:hypothetical protein [Acidisoma silvae]|uniref:Uncharacterized protein n=1 Tax=Acidisoma silvae TaxID=2802396 RepID=A0A963YSP7_9PROT|nr:hypothetical protein [Acidisoma silvae]MCB8876236.1 hypothetical protein [Acidisoma silvae]